MLGQKWRIDKLLLDARQLGDVFRDSLRTGRRGWLETAASVAATAVTPIRPRRDRTGVWIELDMMSSFVAFEGWKIRGYLTSMTVHMPAM